MSNVILASESTKKVRASRKAVAVSDVVVITPTTSPLDDASVVVVKRGRGRPPKMTAKVSPEQTELKHAAAVAEIQPKTTVFCDGCGFDSVCPDDAEKDVFKSAVKAPKRASAASRRVVAVPVVA